MAGLNFFDDFTQAAVVSFCLDWNGTELLRFDRFFKKASLCVKEICDDISHCIFLTVNNSAVIDLCERLEMRACHSFVLQRALTHVEIAGRELLACFLGFLRIYRLCVGKLTVANVRVCLKVTLYCSIVY